MTHSKVLLNDGSSGILLNDGSSFLVLNAEGPTHGGVTIQSIHATQKVFPKKRLVSVSFRFWLKSSLLERVVVKLRNLESYLKPAMKIPTLPVKQLKEQIVKLLRNELKEAKMELKILETRWIFEDPAMMGAFFLRLLARLKKNGR